MPRLEEELLKVAFPLTVLRFEELSLKTKLVIFIPSPPLIALPIDPPHFMEFERVKVPFVAASKMALPVIVPMLYVVSLKVALPIIKTLLELVAVNITPAVLASPVNPVESILAGVVQLLVFINGEDEPTITASILEFGTAFVGTEHEALVYQLPIVFQLESDVPHQT